MQSYHGTSSSRNQSLVLWRVEGSKGGGKTHMEYDDMTEMLWVYCTYLRYLISKWSHIYPGTSCYCSWTNVDNGWISWNWAPCLRHIMKGCSEHFVLFANSYAKHDWLLDTIENHQNGRYIPSVHGRNISELIHQPTLPQFRRNLTRLPWWNKFNYTSSHKLTRLSS